MSTNKNNTQFYILNGLLRAGVYIVSVLLAFIYASFYNLWLLYVGNTLFAAVIFGLVVYVNNRRSNAGLKYLMVSSLKKTTAGVVFSCLLVLLLLLVFNGNIMKRSPVNITHDQTNGMVHIFVLNAIFVNFFFGSFAAVMASTSALRSRNTGLK